MTGTKKYHRFFLTHSVILPLIFFVLLFRLRPVVLKRILIYLNSAFTAGITVHLATDIIPRKTVNFLIDTGPAG